MAHVPVARADALVGRVPIPHEETVWQQLSRHAEERGGETALVGLGPGGSGVRTWRELSDGVERAAAGLIRSGLRLDQVVVSLLPAGHPYPELDLAVRAIGAVLVHIGPGATRDDLARDLSDAEVRLVVADGPEDLGRLEGLPLRASELFALDGGRGWDRLIALGAERLVMDPAAVDRADRVVDVQGTAPRLLAGREPLGRTTNDLPFRHGTLDARAVVALSGHLADPLVHAVREAHLRVGFTLCHVPGAEALRTAVESVRPTVLAVATDAVPDLADALPRLSRQQARPARKARPGTQSRKGARPGAWSRGPLVIAPVVGDAERQAVADLGGAIQLVESVDLLPPDLPRRPPVVMGDVSQLPRRSRQVPGDDFQLHLPGPDEPTDAAVDADLSEDRPDATAFSLPSLPLMSGESFLDKLLTARAAEAQP